MSSSLAGERTPNPIGNYVTQPTTSRSVFRDAGRLPEHDDGIESRFRKDAACRSYLFALRWPDGFACPHRQRTTAWPMANGRWVCAGCRAQISVTTGLFSRTAVTAGRLVQARVSHQWKNGHQRLGLQRVLHWAATRQRGHKPRRAMVRSGRERLHCRRVREAYWGGEERTCGDGNYEKASIVVAAEADGQKIGRIRVRHIADTSRKTFHGFISRRSRPAAPFRRRDYNPFANFRATPTNGRFSRQSEDDDHLCPCALEREKTC